MTVTPLALYMAFATSSTLATAKKLYTIENAAPATDVTYTQIGTGLGWFEILSQGGSPTTAGAIGNPSGGGFFLDDSILSGQDLQAGAYTAIVRLNASQFPSFTQAGTLTADLVVRLFKYDTVLLSYTPIIAMTLSGQTVPSAFTNYSFSGSTGAVTSFTSTSRLYQDVWANVTANANGSAIQGFRLNRQSTVVNQGDPSAKVVTPGYQPTPGANLPFITPMCRPFGSSLIAA